MGCVLPGMGSTAASDSPFIRPVSVFSGIATAKKIEPGPQIRVT
jgi:hypothetical protein